MDAIRIPDAPLIGGDVAALVKDTVATTKHHMVHTLSTPAAAALLVTSGVGLAFFGIMAKDVARCNTNAQLAPSGKAKSCDKVFPIVMLVLLSLIAVFALASLVFKASHYKKSA